MQISAFLITLCIILIFKQHFRKLNANTFNPFLPSSPGVSCLKRTKHSRFAMQWQSKTMLAMQDEVDSSSKKHCKSMHLSLYFQPKLLQVASSKPVANQVFQRKSNNGDQSWGCILLKDLGDTHFPWFWWPAHVFVLLALYRDELRKSRCCPPPPPSWKQLHAERKMEKESKEKKEGNKVEGLGVFICFWSGLPAALSFSSQ